MGTISEPRANTGGDNVMTWGLSNGKGRLNRRTMGCYAEPLLTQEHQTIEDDYYIWRNADVE